MTATVTVKARAWPVTVKVSDDADTIDIHPWQEKQFHIDSSLHLTVTEIEPAADEAVAPVADEGEGVDMLEEAKAEKRSRRAPAADSDSTQIIG